MTLIRLYPNERVSHPGRLKRTALLACLLWLLSLAAGCGSGQGDLPIESLKQKLAAVETYSIILDDMKEEGAFFKTYYHDYLVVQPDSSEKTGWLQVPESYYNETADFMGMALATKKDGTLDQQPAPPGYGYVGDEKYGQWRQDSQGGSFWEFYGKYAFFTSLFGGWYHPINRMDYGMYRNQRSMNQPFFGRNKEYGSTGNLSKAKRPGFYSRRMSSAASGKSAFSSKVDSSRVGRTSTGVRGRAGGFGK